MSAAKHTPGLWMPVKDGATHGWMLLRHLGDSGLCELRKSEDGFLLTFPTQDAAATAAAKDNAAIAKATGSAA